MKYPLSGEPKISDMLRITGALRKILLTAMSIALTHGLALIASAVLITEQAQAQYSGRFFELTLSGSYETRYSQYKENQRKSYGAELLIPLTGFMQISAGHTFLEDKDIYNDEYRTFQEQQGVELPIGSIESIDTYIDSTANAVLFYNFGYVRPSIFGGALHRTYCEENTLADYGCIEQDITWNAGAGLSMIITTNLRLNISHRVSPSVAGKSENKLDALTSLGLTIVY